jgi:hypothetical protein
MRLEDVEEYLAIPYVAVFYSTEREDGEWVRRAEYPELGCMIEAYNEPDLMERLEDERVRTIVAMREQGEEPPRPRPPLTSGVSGLSELPLDQLFRRAMAIPRTK